MHPRGPNKEYVLDISAGRHGFQMSTYHATQSYNVRLRCMNSRCSYTGSFEYFRLAADLAAAALAGHAQYQLTD